MMGRFAARLEARDVEVSYGRIGRPGRTLVRGGGDGERLVVALTRLVARSPLVTHALG